MRGQTATQGLPGVGSSSDAELPTVHQNTILSVRPYDGQPYQVTRVSTSGVDGKLVIWNVAAAAGGGLAGRMDALRM